jgi:uncharacterized protein (TIGR02246 family)
MPASSGRCLQRIDPRHFLVSALLGLALLLPPVAARAETCTTLDARGVAALFDEWNLALASLDADKVAQRYWPDAVLLPTVSNTPRTSPAMVRDYFEHFVAKRPRGRIDTRTVQIGCNLALDMGTYTFSLMNDSGALSDVAARYTFVYQYRDGGWKILHHHSSAMPETAQAAAASSHAAAPDAPAAHDSSAIAPAKATKLASRLGGKPRRASAEAAARDAAQHSSSVLFVNMPASPPIVQFYPPEARKQGAQGVARLRVCAGPDGTISGTPDVLHSSGSPQLDDAARNWARAARWVPATLNRQSVEGCAEIDVRFDLELCKRDSRCPA